LGKEYFPSESVTTVFSCPVALSLSVAVTPATAAPCASVTSPVMVAVVAVCAKVCADRYRATSSKETRTLLTLIFMLSSGCYVQR
jgi:hypothetical protein